MKPLLVVDGYNVIGAWGEAERCAWPIDECRDRLTRRLEDHGGYTGEEVVLVFDGYQAERRLRTQEKHGDVTVVYTRHGETVDSYIERLVAQTPRYRVVRVATSDGLEQSQILSTGATRLTSRELLREMDEAREKGIRTHRAQGNASGKRPIESRIPEETRRILERLRRG